MKVAEEESKEPLNSLIKSGISDSYQTDDDDVSTGFKPWIQTATTLIINQSHDTVVSNDLETQYQTQIRDFFKALAWHLD